MSRKTYFEGVHLGSWFYNKIKSNEDRKITDNRIKN